MKGLSNLEEVVLAAAQRLKPRGAAVSLKALFDSLPQSRGVVKRALLDLEKKGVVAFQKHSFPRRLSREERKAMIREGKDYYHAFAIREVNPMVRRKKAVKKRPAKRRRNVTIVKAKRATIVKANPKRKPAKKRSRRNPYAYQVLYSSGSGGFKKLGGVPANSRSEALKKAEAELKRKGLWRSGTKLITQAAPLDSSAARHKNGKKAAKRKTVKRKTTRRRNSDQAAVAKTKKQFEQFTGRKSRRVVTLPAPQGTPAHTSELGRLHKIKLASGEHYDFEGPKAPYLARDLKGKLHVVGGQYKCNPPGRSAGEIEQIEYIARKPHLGRKKPTIFFHKLGEETGVQPRLQIDKQGLVTIKGGDYYIDENGIHN